MSKRQIIKQLNQIARSDYSNSAESVGDRLARKSRDAVEKGHGVTVSPKLMLVILNEYGF